MQVSFALRRHGWLTWLAVFSALALSLFLVSGTASFLSHYFSDEKGLGKLIDSDVPFLWAVMILSVPPDILHTDTLKAANSHSGALFLWVAWTLIALTVVACASACLGAYIMWQAPNQRANRQMAGLLFAMGSFITLNFFFLFPTLNELSKKLSVLTDVLDLAVLMYVALGFARFLMVFPRAVDAESVHESYMRRPFALRWSSRSTPKRNLLLPWHTYLVSGKLLWAAMAIPAIWYYFKWMVELFIPFDTWGGVAFAIVIGILFLYFVWGLPYSFASITHVHQFGTQEERRRVAILRAILLGFGLVLLLSLVVPFVGSALFPVQSTDPNTALLGLKLIVVCILLWELTPALAVILLGVSVLGGGALDPRIAFTRITLWSTLGLFVTMAFIVIERYATVTVVHWLSLPPDTGTVAAGALIAGTFVPLRNFAGKGVERLAARWIPLEVIAKGERVVRAVAIADLSGYTALSSHDEPGAILQSTALSRQAKHIAEAHDGKLVKGLGDAVMLTFEDAHGAIRSVQELHEAFPRAIEALGVAPLGLHSAIHWGEIVEAHDGDIFGQTVNITARLVDAAASGEIVVSESMRDQLSAETAFHSLGSRKFKNVPEAVECYLLGDV